MASCAHDFHDIADGDDNSNFRQDAPLATNVGGGMGTIGSDYLVGSTENHTNINSEEAVEKESDEESSNKSNEDSCNDSDKEPSTEDDEGSHNDSDEESCTEDDEGDDDDGYYTINDDEVYNQDPIAITDLVHLPWDINTGVQGVGFQFTFEDLPLVIQLEIGKHLFTPEPKEVRALWDGRHQKWTYRTRSPPNVIPITVLRHLSGYRNVPAPLNSMKEAPLLSATLQPYPYFDYESDILVLEYNQCGNRPGDKQEHTRAIGCAISALHKSHVACDELKFLRIVYCPTDTRACEIVTQLGSKLRALQRVTLESHYHYTPESAECGVTYEEDMAMMQDEVDGYQLEGYPFEVILQDANGDALV